MGALVMKAASRIEIARDVARSRYCVDFTVMAALVAARDFRETDLSPKDRRRLRKMVELCRQDEASHAVEDATLALARLERAAAS